MKDENSIGLIVAVFVSDPWEFGTECGVGPFQGVISNMNADSVMIMLSKPIIYRNKSFVSIIARFRYKENDISDLNSKNKIPMNMTLLPFIAETIESIDSYSDCIKIGLIGSIELI